MSVLGSKEENVEKSTTPQKSTKPKPKPILSLELTELIPLIKFHVGILKDKRNISKAISSISSLGLFENYGHLKRCKGRKLLLSSASNIGEMELKNLLTSKGFDLGLLEDDFEIIEVPSKSSKTKKQAEINGKIWPINFHPDKLTESIISGEIFQEDDLNVIELLMKITIEAAKICSIGNSNCNGTALIYDPDNRKIISLASSKIDEHPLWHCAMLAIDLVAKIQGGGAWEGIKMDVNLPSNSTIDNNESKRKLNDDEVPFCYPKSLYEIDFSLLNKERRKRIKMEKNEAERKSSKDESGQYLCTNYWAFLLKEPCPLCAMALLHSRISKIFYGIKSRIGVLGSKGMLHTTPGLNHRYEVWSGVLENYCQIVSDDIKAKE